MGPLPLEPRPHRQATWRGNGGLWPSADSQRQLAGPVSGPSWNAQSHGGKCQALVSAGSWDCPSRPVRWGALQSPFYRGGPERVDHLPELMRGTDGTGPLLAGL